MITGRRDGDIDACFADTEKAFKELGFETKYNVDDMCYDSYNYIMKK